jgi:hypothetical protein
MPDAKCQIPHPPYSSDIDPCDFFLFWYLKHKFQGCFYDSADELFSAITDLMRNLEKSFLHRVFDEWISHLHLVVESGGEWWSVVERGGEWWRVYPNIAKFFCYSASSLNQRRSTSFLTSHTPYPILHTSYSIPHTSI